VLCQRRAQPPLYDLHVAGRRTFWVAAVGGIIVFGIVAVLLGAGLVFFLFPRRAAEERLLARYHAEDNAAAAHPGPSATSTGLSPADRPVPRS
jgi:hypothetical protein